jgi:hypothetical protein
LGIVLDPLWTDTKRRALIRHAMLFFQYRGTSRGLLMALGLSLFDCAPAALFTDTSSRRSPASRIRLIEKFRTREAPAAVLGDPTEIERPRVGVREAMWTPQAGGALLHRRYREYLAANDSAPDPAEKFPLTEPPGDRAALWRRFSRETLGFVPATPATDATSWQQFLARRYHGAAAYNTAYRRAGVAAIDTFTAALRPSDLPADGAALVDWYDFETVVLPMQAADRSAGETGAHDVRRALLLVTVPSR